MDKCGDLHGGWGDRCKDAVKAGNRNLNSMSKTFHEDALPILRQTFTPSVSEAMQAILASISFNDEYYAFIACRDKNSRVQVGGVEFIKFKVNPYGEIIGEEDFAPKVVLTDIEELETTEKLLHVYTNELAECYYNINIDENIENTMQCSSTIYGTYQCSETFAQFNPEDKVYVRCIDHPEHYESYSVKLKNAAEFAIVGDSSGMVLDENEGNNRVTVKDLSRINISQRTIEVNTPAVELILDMAAIGEEAECKYADEDIDFDDMTQQFMPAEGPPTQACTKCFAGFASPVDEDEVFIKCHFTTSTEDRNMMQESAIYPEES